MNVKGKNQNAKDVVLSKAQDHPFLFNCPQTSPGPSQCRGIWLSCFIRTAVERKKGRGREGESGGWVEEGGEGNVWTDRSISTFVPSSYSFYATPPHPKPSILICPVSQIPSHVTIGQLYNRGHPTFRLHSVFFGIVASAQSITD